MQVNHEIAQNRWNLLPKVVWGKIFIDYFTYDDLIIFHDVCHYWRSVVTTASVTRALMAEDGIDYVEGEHWLGAFAKRKIIIALDCSSSMSIGTEDWRYSVAIQQAKALVQRFKNFAAVKGITFVPFADKYSTIRIRHAAQIDEQMALIKEDQNKPEGIGNGNGWESTFNCILDAIGESSKASVYMLSDLEIGSQNFIHPLWKTAFKIPPKIFFCRIGNSQLGIEFLDFACRQESAEPPTKKARNEGNTICVQNHIPRVPERPIVSREPTVILEPNQTFQEENGAIYDPMNVDFNEEDAQNPTEVDEVDEVEDPRDYPQEDYMDDDSSSGEYSVEY